MQDKNKVSKFIDGEKLHKDLTMRYDSLNEHIWRDFAGNPEPFYNKWMETKYHKEKLERGEYNLNWEEVMNQLEFNSIHFNDVILHLESKWNRKLSEHEKHILIEGFKYGKSTHYEVNN